MTGFDIFRRNKPSAVSGSTNLGTTNYTKLLDAADRNGTVVIACTKPIHVFIGVGSPSNDNNSDISPETCQYVAMVTAGDEVYVKRTANNTLASARLFYWY